MFNWLKKIACTHQWIVEPYQSFSCATGCLYSIKQKCSKCNKEMILHKDIGVVYTLGLYESSLRDANYNIGQILQAIKSQNPDYYVIGIDDIND